jgi:hypothetical protein
MFDSFAAILSSCGDYFTTRKRFNEKITYNRLVINDQQLRTF